MEYTFWLEPSDNYVKVIDKIKEIAPDFEFQVGKNYLITLEKPCKVHEKILQPARQEGICVDYYFGKPKLFAYTPTRGFFWIVNANIGGSYVTVTEVQ